MAENLPPRTPAVPAAKRRSRWAVSALLLAAVLAVPVLYRMRYASAIYPGVRLGTVDLGGLAPKAAEERLRAAGIDPTTRGEKLSVTDFARLAATSPVQP